MLANWDIESVSCENGQIALETIKTSEPFDVIICDYHMPDIDGLETIQKIQKNQNSSSGLQTILLLSSSDNADLYSKCDELGVKFRLTKPVKSDELYSYLCSISHPTRRDQKVKENETLLVEKQEFSEPASVLIAEDNVFNMLLINAIISDIFPTAKIIEAKNGKEAVMLWVIEQPELILMDMQMPEMGGVEATMRIREQEKDGHHTPIVALTAGALKEEKERCLAAGMNDFLTKPIEPTKLKEVIIRIFN
jgi:CheY-like chemotaxis protein